jgi:hydrogenase/urease accessory protein HupE
MQEKQYLGGWRGWMTAFVISLASSAQAHDPGLSTAALKLFPDRLEAEVTFARADIEALVPLDQDGNGKVSQQEWDSAQPQLENLSREALNVLMNGDSVIITGPDFQLDENNNFRISGVFPSRGAKALKIESPLIAQLARGHRQFMTLLDGQGASLAEELLSADHNVVELSLPDQVADANGGQPPSPEEITERQEFSGGHTPPTPIETARTGTFTQFFFMGVEHILTGYDHLLFLFGLLIAMSQFRATVWVITCFTLAHSATLALAAFDLVRIPSHIVEPLIATTIIYVGVENLLRSGGPTGRWKLTLIFGTIHGLGFATELKEKLAGMIGAKIAVPLVSFNLGVELGQMAVATLVLPLIWWLRAEPALMRRSLPVCSTLVVLAGAWWLFERTLQA